jgi:hypothetical protein
MIKRSGFVLVIIMLCGIAVLQVVFLFQVLAHKLLPVSSEQINKISFSYRSIMYIITGIVILIEIKNLDKFHIDQFTVATFILSSFLRTKTVEDIIFRVIIGLIGVLIILNLISAKPKIPRTNFKYSMISIGIAGISVVLIIILELFLRDHWQTPPLIRNSLITSILNGMIKEFSIGAVTEEMIFRGFLWGYLQKLSWNENRIIWTQGLLFWLLHISRIVTPLNFFLFIPLLTFIVSRLTYQTKQVFPAIVYHTTVNVTSSLLNLATY